MGNTSENRKNNPEEKTVQHISIGLLAHVDAGKTTLSESLMYLTGTIRKAGRVDHRDAFLDTYELEKSRGITIFSKQAVFWLGEKQITLVDTPGHVDFSAETERTLRILDYAVLVISGADGVQGHTRTLWKLLKAYQIPVFIFVNKMDQEGTDQKTLLQELSRQLSDGCILFSRGDRPEEKESYYEALAMCDESALEEYLQSGMVSEETVRKLISGRKVFPCYFGSALKMEGVGQLISGLEYYTESREEKRNQDFGARVFKISRDDQGNRLTHLRVTKGRMKVKDLLTGRYKGESWEEKVNQIRIYSGEKYETVQQAEAGEICAVTGLSFTYAGEGIGTERSSDRPLLEPVLNYRVRVPENCDIHRMLGYLRQIEEEDPMLRVVWEEELGEIYVQLMGAVQTEILQSMIHERFGEEVSFDTGNIVYKETIKTTVEGVGHFEPLRHYAEVHLIMEPGEPGSGLVFGSACSEEMLDRSWQRLILTHLAEKRHRGVLTGSEITDMKITLVSGKSHLKHTEGGDFRQATYRAVRQGLMQAENVLLEPYYSFRLEVPAAMVGRAMTDIQRMSGEVGAPQTEGEMAVLTGSAPVAAMRDYQAEVLEYTRGEGHLSCELKGYEPCHNPETVIEAKGYNPDHDTENPTGSIFCSHGAGIYVPWNQVPDHMHIDSQYREAKSAGNTSAISVAAGTNFAGKEAAQKPRWDKKEEKELEEIFIRTYGKYESKTVRGEKTVVTAEHKNREKKQGTLREYLLVDGYNVIFAWEDLKQLAKDNMEGARGKLMDILSNYQGFRKCTVILVFDAYKIEGDVQAVQQYRNIYVVYTKEAETADQYIEKVVHEIGRKYRVTVVTSDAVEQVVAIGQGGTLISAREFREEVETVRRQIREEYEKRRETGKRYLFDVMDEDLAHEIEELRLGKKQSGAKEKGGA